MPWKVYVVRDLPACKFVSFNPMKLHLLLPPCGPIFFLNQPPTCSNPVPGCHVLLEDQRQLGRSSGHTAIERVVLRPDVLHYSSSESACFTLGGLSRCWVALWWALNWGDREGGRPRERLYVACPAGWSDSQHPRSSPSALLLQSTCWGIRTEDSGNLPGLPFPTRASSPEQSQTRRRNRVLLNWAGSAGGSVS